MRPAQILTSLLIPGIAAGLPTTRAEEAQTCSLYKFAEAPINPPACWAWYADTSHPSDYCGASTFTPIASISASSPSPSPSPSSTWLDSCASLRTAQLSSPRDFFLADYATDKFNILLASGSCSFQVQPATPPSSDQVYIGSTDVVDILESAIAASRKAGGNAAVEGSMTCSPGIVRWKIVPI
ncbi:uncharacterized protein F4812DRAFT_199943 [Daldinia caldariorum]|uniref:uncharacterized protein n=1 Tax=Daldinia caldariorum TaxID=326644 RepID=UPI0020077D43|nr:uncharacterized protein F4812DRAFT_199943 [Daldinia caldariorum]KAI1471942.1 hypothetical protein F4812DRAFT_199943 [Daldinia caldariorum]